MAINDFSYAPAQKNILVIDNENNRSDLSNNKSKELDD